MKPPAFVRILLASSVAALLGACANPLHNAIFVTKTSMSIVDADTTPATMSIGYSRDEGYFGPRYPDGKIFPVASAIETRGEGFDRQIRQVYATGDAARIVTDGRVGGTPTGVITPTNPADAQKVVFFATGTSVGVKLGFTEGTPVPSSFNFGYKRKEFSVIPVDPGREPSVIGTFTNATSAPTTASPTTGFGVQQYFATGAAAEQLAALPSIKANFKDKAERSLGDVEKFRNREAVQGRAALDIVSCLTKVPDARIPEVWINARHLGIFRDLGAEQRVAGQTPAVQRSVYLSLLNIALDPDNDNYTNMLAVHKNVVCTKLSG